jgi:hypothetical protein
MVDLLAKHRANIEVLEIELLALKKLSLVSHALASKFSYRAAKEQQTLAQTLDDIIRRIELSAASSPDAPASEGR